MDRTYRTLAAIISATMISMTASPSLAQLPWAWATNDFDKSEYDTLHPLIQSMLRDSVVGDVRPWHSASGREGRVYLVSGGDQAHSTDAEVRITIIGEGGRENRLFTFKYRKDVKKGWNTVG